jgi:hypothetical protein
MTAHTFVTWMVVIAVMAEGGAYAAANLLLLIAQMLLFRLFFVVLRVITLPTYAVLRRDSSRWLRFLRGMEFFFNALEAMFLFWAMVESYRPNDNGPYNLAMTGFVFTVGISQVSLIGVSVFQARRLLRMIRAMNTDIANNNLSNDAKMKPVRYQLEQIIYSSVVMMPTFAGFLLVPIVFLILGNNLPWQIVLFSFMHVTAPVFHIRACVVIRNKVKHASMPASADDANLNTAKNDSAVSPSTGGTLVPANGNTA